MLLLAAILLVYVLGQGGWSLTTPILRKVQSLDYTSLHISVKELKRSFVPSLVETIVQDDEFNVALGLRTQVRCDVAPWLHFCWHPSYARVGLGKPLELTSKSTYSFASTLRSALKDLTVTDISIPNPFERIVHVDLSERLSDPLPKWRIIVEIAGSRSNAILVSGPAQESPGTITACAYQVSSSKTVRPLQTGSTYFPPPPQGGVFVPCPSLPLSTFIERLQALHSSSSSVAKPLTVGKALSTTFKGMSPNIISMLLRYAHIKLDAPLEMILSSGSEPKDELKALHIGLRAWAECLTDEQQSVGAAPTASCDDHMTLSCLIEPKIDSSGSYTCLALHSNERPSAELPASPSILPEKELHVLDERSTAHFLMKYYTTLQQQTSFDLLHASCCRKIMHHVTRSAAIRAQFLLRKQDASTMTEIQAQADLVTSYLHAWDPATPSLLSCSDFMTGKEVIVALPPNTSPSDFAASLYKRAKKLRRSVDVLEALLASLEVQASILADLEASLEFVPMYTQPCDLAALQELASELAILDERPTVSITASDDDSDDGKTGHDQGSSMSGKRDKASKGSAEKVPLKGKSKYLAGKEKVLAKKAAIIAESEGRGRNRKIDTSAATSGQSKGKEKGKRKSPLQDLMVLRPEPSRTTDTAVVDPLPPLVVGRNSRQNDRVTFEVSQEHHLWFHVAGSPGAHCLLLLSPGQAASPDALQYAADVAAFYSKASGSSNVPVTYALPKYVKRVSGGGPGMVSILRQEGVIWGRPSQGKEFVQLWR